MIGRRRELSELRGLLGGGGRLVSVTGPGGIGKTALATAVLPEVTRFFPDGTALVDLTQVSGATVLVPAVGRASGAHLTEAEDAARLVAALADRRILLVLDGCDRLPGELAGVVDRVLAGCPGVSALVTARQPLGLTGEAVLRLGPLDCPGDRGHDGSDPAALASCEAVRLFVERATSRRPSFRLTPDNAEAVAGICVAVGGVPLALELAAGRVTVLSPQGILDRMHDRFRLLGKGDPDAPPQLRSLRASIDLSDEVCTGQERELWSRITVFAGGADLEAVEEVCTGDGIEAPDVLDLVDGLLAKSVLVRADSDPVRARYRLPTSLWQYAVERRPDAARRIWQDRHLAWCAGLVEDTSAQWFGDRQPSLLHRARLEHANLAEALAHAVQTGQERVALRMAAGLRFSWLGTGRVGEGRAWLDRALALPGEATQERLEARVLAAWLSLAQGDDTDAGRHLDSAHRLAGETGVALPPTGVLAAGALTAIRGDPAGGVPAVDRAIERARRDGDDLTRAAGYVVRGMCRWTIGDRDEADAALRAAIAVSEAAGEWSLRAYACGLLGVLALGRGDLGVAEQIVRPALRPATELGDRFAVALVLDVLAGVAAARDDPNRAATLQGAGAVRWRVLGLDPGHVPFLAATLAPMRRVGVNRAQATLARGDYEDRWRTGAGLAADQVIGFALYGVLETRPSGPVETSPLTTREEEVARLVAQGLTNRDLAARLGISPRTAQGHVENILRKLGFRSRTQVAGWVAQLQTDGGGRGTRRG